MMVRWMCSVSLKYRKQSEVLYSLLGVQSVLEVDVLKINDDGDDDDDKMLSFSLFSF